MDMRLAYKITDLLPKNCQSGYILGEIYEITDYTEPNNIYKYPVLIHGRKDLKISALFVEYELNINEPTGFYKKLKAYEGPLYKFARTKFYNMNNRILYGYAAVAKNKFDLQNNSNAKKITGSSKPYIFLKCAIL